MTTDIKENEINRKCAPSKSYKDGSCFTYDNLKEIAEAYNKKSSNKINIIDGDKMNLVNQIENRLKNNCDDQVCWIRQDFVKKINSEEIQNNTFRPEGPSKKYDWLSTTHINDVIDQYHKIHKNFKFLGAVPIDFDDLPVLGICDIILKILKIKE